MKQKPGTPEPRAAGRAHSHAGKITSSGYQPRPGPSAAAASCAFAGDVNIHSQRGCSHREAKRSGLCPHSGLRCLGRRPAAAHGGCCRALPAQIKSHRRHRGHFTSSSGGKANLWLLRFTKQLGVCGEDTRLERLSVVGTLKQEHLFLRIIPLPLPNLSAAVGAARSREAAT